MRYRLNDRELVSEVLDDEVIIIHLQSGTYYSTLASGADIWNALLSGRTVEEIADWLARGADDERAHIVAEVAQFVSELVAEDLILSTDSDPIGRVRPGSGVRAAAEDGPRRLKLYCVTHDILLQHFVKDAI